MEPKPDEIMAWLNSDDLLLPGTLEYVAAYFASHPQVDVIYGHRYIIDESDMEIGRWYLPTHSSDSIKWVDYIPQETLFWRSTAWLDLKGLDENFQFALDWAFLINLEQNDNKIKRLPEFLGCFRMHSNQKTNLHINTTGLMEMHLLRPAKGLTSLEIEKRIRDSATHECRKSAICYRIEQIGLKT